MPRLQIMDTTIRDGQQSLWATRMQIGDMLPILPKMDRVGYWAIEAWGGATFDSCLRFLDENPWERLRAIKANTPNTPLAMLSRGQNLVGYKHYSKEIVHRFINAAHRNGVEVFRVFDALNDIRNVVDNAEAIKECGGLFEGAISYTISPVHTLDSYLEYGQQLKDLGVSVLVTQAVEPTVASGAVIRTDPAAGSQVAAGSTVVVYISRPQVATTTKVPSLVGMSTEDARTLLVQNHLSLGGQTQQYSSQPAGTVLSQSPEAGSEAKLNSRVSIVVSAGPQPQPEPEAPSDSTGSGDWWSGLFGGGSSSSSGASSSPAETGGEQSTEGSGGNTQTGGGITDWWSSLLG